MVGKAQWLAGHLAFPLRVLAVAGALVINAFPLLRQSERNTKAFDDFVEELTGAKVPLWRRCLHAMVVPLRNYFALWTRIPTFAGSRAVAFRRRVDAVYARVLALSDTLNDGRSFLITRPAREVQTDCMSEAFRNLLAVNLDTQQALSISFYAQSSEAVLDFLDFCRVNGQLDSWEKLVAALPIFADRIRPHYYRKLRDDKDGPQRGEICRAPIPDSIRLTLQTELLRPVHCLTKIYWSGLQWKESLEVSDVPEPDRELTVSRFNTLAERLPHNVRGALAFETHIEGYRLMGELAAKSSEAVDLARRFRPLLQHKLADLEANALRAANQ